MNTEEARMRATTNSQNDLRFFGWGVNERDVHYKNELDTHVQVTTRAPKAIQVERWNIILK